MPEYHMDIKVVTPLGERTIGEIRIGEAGDIDHLAIEVAIRDGEEFKMARRTFYTFDDRHGNILKLLELGLAELPKQYKEHDARSEPPTDQSDVARRFAGALQEVSTELNRLYNYRPALRSGQLQSDGGDGARKEEHPTDRE